jgi:PAS domain S-box-containing protein
LKSTTNKSILLAQVQVAIAMLDYEFNYLEVSERWLQDFGLKGKDIIGLNHLHIFSDKAKEWEKVFRASLEGKTIKNEEQLVKADGNTAWFRWDVRPWHDEEGYVGGLVFCSEDITEQKKAEEESIQLLNNTEECFVLISKELKIVTFNKQFNTYYQTYLKKQVIKGDSILDYVQPERVEIVKEVYRKVLGGEEIVTEITIPNGNDLAIFSNHYKPAYDDNGALYGAFITSKDITEEKKTKELIEANERRFRSLVENSGDAIAVLTPDAKVVYISPSVEKILGYTEHDIYTTDLVSLIHPDDIPYKAEKLHLVLANPGVPVKEVTGRMKHKDGSWRWIEATMTNMLHDPNINGIIDNFKDITHKKQLEQEREFEKRDKEALINSTLDLIWSVDRNFKLIAANNAFLTNLRIMVGCTLKPGDNLLEIPGITEEFIVFWHKLYTRALAGTPFSTEFYTPETGGNPPNWSEVNLNPIFDGDKIVGIACFGKIITENKRIESLHILEKEVLESYTTQKMSLHDTITYLLKGIEQIHPEMKCSVLKLTEGKLYNSSSPSLPQEYLATVNGLDIGAGEGSCGTAASLKEKVIVEDIAISPLWKKYKEIALKYKLRACWSFPIIDTNGNVLGTFAIYYDKVHSPRKDEEETLERCRAILTTIIENQIAQEAIMHSEQRLKDSETALKILNAELEERVCNRTSELVNANRQLESFSYSVSHDLRSPLRSIHGFSQLLSRRLSDSLSIENMELLSMIQSNTIRMENLIEDMLEFSRISKLNTNKRLIDTNELVDVVWQNLSARDGINVVLTINQLPQIMADRPMLTQVFVNLLSNAVKYSSKRDRAEIEVGAEISEQSIIYYVKDNGAGFDMKHYDKLFAAFQRLHSPIDFEGTGVGLAIVKSIIEKHDGKIWAEGKENEGATFSFELPRETA